MKFRYFVLVLLILSLPVRSHSLTLEEERKYGREVYLQIAKSAPINNDPYISMHLLDVKDRLEAASTLPFPITLTVIDSEGVDAFATIGGYVFITTGLIGLCDKEEELAGVLAHEFTHVARRHVARSLEKEKVLNVGMLASVLLSMLIPNPAAQAAAMTTGMGATMAASLKYTREMEEEADRGGAVVADKAGYGALGTAEFLKKLRSGGGDKLLPQYLLTHPYHEDRITRIESAWQGNKPRIVDDFFPYLATRVQVLHNSHKEGMENMWLNRYMKDRSNPSVAYGLSLVYSMKGKTNESINIAKDIKSPYRDLFLGEILVNARRFGDAIEVLKNDAFPLSRFFLAKAFEGKGDRSRATGVFGELLQYGDTFPEIYYRYGMLSGRGGDEARGFAYLGRYYLQTGRQDLARHNFEKAIAKYGMNSKEGQELLKLFDTKKK
jgi:beta-barrel assembly-enhancing protease